MQFKFRKNMLVKMRLKKLKIVYCVIMKSKKLMKTN